jgi:glycerol uptake facilitator-like aquaporin
MAEVVGTFILMFCVCGIIASTHQNDAVGLLEYAATAGLTVVVIIFSIGPISCAHVNPAVTIAFATIGQISMVQGSISFCYNWLFTFFLKKITLSLNHNQSNEWI